MPGPEHFREPIPESVLRAAQARKAEDIDGRSDRPGLVGTLSQAADIILEVVRAQQEHDGVALPIYGEHADWWALTGVKTLMLAGWSAPSERTIGIPNGLVLLEVQWRALAEYDRVWVILPGGERALELAVSQSQSPVPDYIREQLWKLREDANDVTHGSSTWDQHGLRDVTVPRSFLSFLVQLVTELRRAGDYAAANSLDNSLATIAPQLREAKIPWSDGGGATPASASPMRITEDVEQLHRDIITVLRYVSGGFDYTRNGAVRYPDREARRALGKIDLWEVPEGETTDGAPGHPLPWWSPLRASSGTSPKPIDVKPVEDMTIAEVRRLISLYEDQHPELTRVALGPDTAVTRSTPTSDAPTDESVIFDLRDGLRRAQEDNQRTKSELLGIVTEHHVTREDVEGVVPEKIRAGYVAQLAATLIQWYDDELEKIKRTGVPGVVHEVDAAFHKLAIIERDSAWAESARRKERIDELEAELAKLRAQVPTDAPHNGDA